jgi:hypothetical protein
MGFVIGVILLNPGLWRSARQNPGKRTQPSQATIFRVRAVLVSTGLFLAVGGALPGVWINEAMKKPNRGKSHTHICLM